MIQTRLNDAAAPAGDRKGRALSPIGAELSFPGASTTSCLHNDSVAFNCAAASAFFPVRWRAQKSRSFEQGLLRQIDAPSLVSAPGTSPGKRFNLLILFAPMGENKLQYRPVLILFN